MTSVFLLTCVAQANDPHFKEAQKFFYESQQLQKKGTTSAPVYNTPPSARNFSAPRNLSAEQQSPMDVASVGQSVQSTAPVGKPTRTAIYLSFINEKYSGLEGDTPDLRTSLGLSIPILNTQGGKTKGEFVILSDIRNASEWGRVRFYHRESLSLIRWNFTQLELFAAAGLGYGYGDLIGSGERFFAPWSAGIFFNQIHKEQPVFYRFELGFTGDLSFNGRTHSSGFFANISLGYKL